MTPDEELRGLDVSPYTRIRFDGGVARSSSSWPEAVVAGEVKDWIRRQRIALAYAEAWLVQYRRQQGEQMEQQVGRMQGELARPPAGGKLEWAPNDDRAG
jgi:hypothetical protein